jgi:hypothetical protein
MWGARVAPGEARHPKRVPLIRVKAFIYDQAQTGVCAATRLKILNERSLSRTALKRTDIPAFQDVAEDDLFPMENINLDSEDTDVSREESASDALTALAEQVGRLPEEVAAGVEIVPRDSILLLSLPLSEDHRVTVRYDSGDSCPRPTAVFLAMPSVEDPIDITAGVLAAKSVSLLDIYQLARTAPLGLPAHCRNRPVVQLPRQGAGSRLAQPAVPTRKRRRGVYETERSDHHVG